MTERATCWSCGGELSEAARYCSQCGTRLDVQGPSGNSDVDPGTTCERRQLTVMFCDLVEFDQALPSARPGGLHHSCQHLPRCLRSGDALLGRLHCPLCRRWRPHLLWLSAGLGGRCAACRGCSLGTCPRRAKSPLATHRLFGEAGRTTTHAGSHQLAYGLGCRRRCHRAL